MAPRHPIFSHARGGHGQQILSNTMNIPVLLKLPLLTINPCNLEHIQNADTTRRPCWPSGKALTWRWSVAALREHWDLGDITGGQRGAAWSPSGFFKWHSRPLLTVYRTTSNGNAHFRTGNSDLLSDQTGSPHFNQTWRTWTALHFSSHLKCTTDA